MTISFGVEFEFDYIKPDNSIVTFSGREPTYLAQGWSSQEDHTASSEVSTPVLTSLEQYINECNKQFRNMINECPDLIPYMCNRSGRSLGQHLHIGKPEVRLSRETKRKIAKEIIKYYPFLAGIQVQPIPSNRGLSSIWCVSMAYYRDVIDRDHHAEISDSHVGTVELRLFDCNIPQSSLVNIFFTTAIAKKALRNRNDNNNNNFDFENYKNERERVLRYGLIGINVTEYLKNIKRFLGNIEIPNIPSLKEILFLIAKYRISTFGLWKYVDAKPYDYMKKCLEDTSKYLENLIQLNDIRHKEKLERWIEQAKEIENLEQLIGLSIGVDRSLSKSLITRIEQTIENQTNRATTISNIITSALGRTEVRRAIEEHNYSILRINQVPRHDTNRVAEIISYLLFYHGDNVVNNMTPREIIEASERFYVFVANSNRNNNIQICGAIAVRLSDGEIKSLVVDRRYRRLGIARILVEHTINVLRENNRPRAIAYIRTNNIASQRLFESLGFRPVERNNRSILYEKILGGA